MKFIANDDDELLDAQERTNVKLKTVQQEYDDEEFVGYEQPKKAHKPEPIEILKTIEVIPTSLPRPNSLEIPSKHSCSSYKLLFRIWICRHSHCLRCFLLARKV